MFSRVKTIYVVLIIAFVFFGGSTTAGVDNEDEMRSLLKSLISSLNGRSAAHEDGMARTFAGPADGGDSEPNTVALDKAIHIIENVLAGADSGDVDEDLLNIHGESPAADGRNRVNISGVAHMLVQLINLRDVVKARQRNGRPSNADLNPGRDGLGSERSMMRGQEPETADIARRDFHTKNCFKLGQICGFYRDSCCSRDTEYGSNAPLCCIRLGGVEMFLSNRYGYCLPKYDTYTCEEMQRMYSQWQR